MSVVSSSPAIAATADPLRTPASINVELARAKAAFFPAIESTGVPLHIVLGNEAADLDSVCTSIAKAILLKAMNPGSVEVFLPVMNMRREDLALRRDSVRILELSDVDPANLVFIDEVKMLPALAAAGRLKVHLVDHNELAIGQEYLAPSVVGIIDHHVPGNSDYPQLSAGARTIERCASSATLLAEEILRIDSRLLTSQLATMLLASIAVDSVNFSQAGPGTFKDSEIGNELFHRAGEKFSYLLGDELIARREDVSGYSTRQLLIRDLKRYREGAAIYAIASLPRSTQWRVSDDARYEPDLASLCADRELNLVMGLLWGGEVPKDQRTLKIFSPDPSIAIALADQLMSHPHLGQTLTRGVRSDSSILTLHCTEPLTRKALQPQFIGLDFGG